MVQDTALFMWELTQMCGCFRILTGGNLALAKGKPVPSSRSKRWKFHEDPSGFGKAPQEDCQSGGWSVSCAGERVIGYI